MVYITRALNNTPVSFIYYCIIKKGKNSLLKNEPRWVANSNISKQFWTMYEAPQIHQKYGSHCIAGNSIAKLIGAKVNYPYLMTPNIYKNMSPFLPEGISTGGKIGRYICSKLNQSLNLNTFKEQTCPHRYHYALHCKHKEE